MNRLVLTTAFAALSLSPALAQTTPPATPSTPPSATAPSTTTTTTAPSPGSASGQFITQQQSGQLMASNLIDTRVYGQNNENIGDINDLVVDQSGNVTAVVLGVGGFLGIGEKNVAIPMKALKIEPQANNNDPRITISMTKQQLEQAPAFQTAAKAGSTTGTTTTRPSTTTTTTPSGATSTTPSTTTTTPSGTTAPMAPANR